MAQGGVVLFPRGTKAQHMVVGGLFQLLCGDDVPLQILDLGPAGIRRHIAPAKHQHLIRHGLCDGKGRRGRVL